MKAVFILLIGLFSLCMPGLSYAGNTDGQLRTECGVIASVISNCDEGIVPAPVSVAQDLPVSLRAPSTADRFYVPGCLLVSAGIASSELYSNLCLEILAGNAFPLYLFHSVLLI